MFKSPIVHNVGALPCSSGIEKLLFKLEMKMKSDIQISPCTSATIAAMHCSLSVPGMIYSIAQLLTCRLVYCFFERLKSNDLTMSKQLVNAISNLNYHVAELRQKMKSIHQARLDMIYYPNTPKYDLIVSALLPKLEAEVKQEKESVEYWAGELAKAKYEGHENYENWYA